MKRQKRSSEQRAFNRGYQAGVSGKSKSTCPTGVDTIQQQWLTGWRRGREDNWDGMTGVAGVHRIPGITT